MEFFGTPEQQAALFAALAATQGKVQNAVKSSKNETFQHQYATLTDHLDQLRPILGENGLAVVQAPCATVHGSNAPGAFELQTCITHKDGGFLRTHMPMLLHKDNMQGLGSAITFARRYQLGALFNMGLEEDPDDDGNAASGAGEQTVQAGNTQWHQRTKSTVQPRSKDEIPNITVAVALEKIAEEKSLAGLDSKESMARSIFKGKDLEAVVNAISEKRKECSTPG